MEIDSEKIKHLLEHWIEHSMEHTAKYEEWSEKLKDKPEVSELLKKAVEKFKEGESYLKMAKDRL